MQLIERLHPDTVSNIVADAVARGLEAGAECAVIENRAFVIEDEACYVAGIGLLSAIMEQFDLAGSTITDSHMERAARPYVLPALKARGWTMDGGHQEKSRGGRG